MGDDVPRKLGFVLIILGALELAWAGWQTYMLGEASSALGGLAAGGIFFVILGMVFFFPTMLTDDTGATSSMRVAVLMVVSLFVIVTLKAGWGARSLNELNIQQNWAWVLAAAFGGKAFQSFAEKKGDESEASRESNKTLQLPQ